LIADARTAARHPRAVFDVSGMFGSAGPGASFHASFGMRGHVRGLVSAALALKNGADDLRATDLPIGAGLGWRWQRRRLAIEAHGQLVVAPHWIAMSDNGDRLAHSEVRLGAGVLATAAAHLTGPVWASVTGRLVGYRDRQRYLVGGREVYSTGHVDASISAGVSITAGGLP
jgi:hypothetical protein